MVFCLLWRYLQRPRCRKWPRSDTDILCRTCEKWSTSKESRCTHNGDTVGLLQALLDATGFCYGQKQEYKVGHRGHLLKAEESRRCPTVGHCDRTKEMPAHYVEGWILWFPSGAAQGHKAAQAFLCLPFTSAAAVLSRSPAPVLRPGFPKLGHATGAAASELEGIEETPQLPRPVTKLVGFFTKWSSMVPEMEKICRKDTV